MKQTRIFFISAICLALIRVAENRCLDFSRTGAIDEATSLGCGMQGRDGTGRLRAIG
jgi:hypothetical protein